MAEITQELVKSLVNYDPDTGLFTWRVDGSIAGAPKDERGYIRIGIGKFRLYAHRLAFFYMTGEWPQCVDHIDQDKTNTRWANLRAATKSQNGMNRGAAKSNATGHKGVYFQANGYVAEVRVGGKKHYLGRFKSADDAAIAAKNAREKLHGEFAYG